MNNRTWDPRTPLAAKAVEKMQATPIDSSTGLGLTDSDIWGLQCAIQHGIRTGYFTENADWANAMIIRLSKWREDSE